MKSHIICKVSELPVGERKLVEIDGKSIGIFNVGGEYYALRNLCPHQMAPLCLGKVTGYCKPGKVGEFNWARQGEIVRCPWHGWEFDIKDGKSIFNPHKVKTRSYRVGVEHAEPEACGNVLVETGTAAEGVETFSVEMEEGMVVLYA